ncbi:glycoside hydrolase superfamily [Pyrenochaeta sp. MPI-SDFR-AT-0127]|nr:glycoside hydrolase superfamily [Pyrenochaeta sp. MPI-SDFR-AT-0127]
MKATQLVCLAFASVAFSTALEPLKKRAVGTATVRLASPSGTPQQLGSGVLYGIPITADGSATMEIPESFYRDIGFNYGRAGGAAWDAPNRGWAFGQTEYPFRFNAALSNYRTTRNLGAPFFLLPHDLWGIDKGPAPLPGDNGDWSLYDAFLARLVSDIKRTNIIDGLRIDIWNEPDGGGYWPRSQAQYLDMWARTYAYLKRELPSVPLAGPATAVGPASDNSVFNGWADFVARNGSVPDIYTWHDLDPNRVPTVSANYFNDLKIRLGLPQRDIVVNEYLAYAEEGPGVVAWYLGQYERLNIRGLRANWAKGGENADTLHNLLANLLGPLNHAGPYYPNGEFQVLKYYNNMRGQRVGTSPAPDSRFEVFATTDTGIAKILAATRRNTDIYSITVTGFNAFGKQGTVRKRSLGFTWNGILGQIGNPVDFGVEVHPIVDDSVTFDVYPRSNAEAYAFEFF